MNKPRIVCWYSHGAASLVATKLAIDIQPSLYPDYDLVVVNIFIKDEFQEPELNKDVEKYLGHKFTVITSEKYNSSVDTVIEKTRYMSGVRGARCTTELKKEVRKAWQRPDDIHVFGLDCNELERVDQIIDGEPELNIWTPLINAGLSKHDCFRIMQEAGLPLPKMYQLGYHNNNCVGCLKAGGAGYWNKIRTDFPEVFAKRARQEELLNVALVKMGAKKVIKKWPETVERMKNDRYGFNVDNRGYVRIPLRLLPEDAGNHKDLDIGSCGFFCEVK